MQAALWIYNLTALVLIALFVNKRISSLASDDQMAPPFGNLPPLKSWTKLFTFVLICADFFISIKRTAALSCNSPFAYFVDKISLQLGNNIGHIVKSCGLVSKEHGCVYCAYCENFL